MVKNLVTLGLLVAAFTVTALVRYGPGSTGLSEPPTVRAAVVRFDAGLAITDVTVIDGTGRDPQPGRTVVVLEGRIAAVRPADEVALGPEVRVIAGRGRYLIPGLWDMHTHLTEPDILPLLTRHGVTGVRHMYSMSPIFPGKLAFDPADPTHPRTVGSTHMLDGHDNPFRWPVNMNVIAVTDPAGAGEAVSRAIRLGNDQIKVYPMLTGPVYTAVVNAARERGIDVVGHLPKAVLAAAASDAGQRSIEHLDGVAVGCSARPDRWTAMRNQTPLHGHGFDDLSGWRVQLAAHDDFDDRRAAELFATFVRNDTYHVPTLVQTHASARLRDAAWDEGGLPPLLRVAWQRKLLPDGGVEIPAVRIRMDAAELNDRARLSRMDLATAGRMHRAGVKLLAGTDTPYPGVLPGDALHTELELLVRAGLTPVAAGVWYGAYMAACCWAVAAHLAYR